MFANERTLRPARVAGGMLIALLLVAPNVSADGPSLDGVNGLLRVHSASPATPGYIGGTVYGLYAREAFLAGQSARNRYEVVKFGGGMLSLGYAASPYVEIGLRGSVESQWAVAAGAESFNEMGFTGVGFDIKTLLTPAEARRWALGAELSLDKATGNKNALTGTWDADGVDLGGRLALTYSHLQGNDDPSLLFHMNTGYLNRTAAFEDATAMAALAARGGTPDRSVTHGDQFLYGAGVEIPVPRQWSFFAEWTGEYDMDASYDFRDNPMRVTPGFRWATRSRSVHWTNGVEISLANETAGPAWQVISGLTLGGFATPVRGSLIGVVRDAETGEPVPGVEVAVRNSKDAPVRTDFEGRFETKIEQGFAVLELSAENYNAKSRVVEIAAHDTVEFDFTISHREVFGGLRGRIRDNTTGAPLFARVRVAGTENWIETDPATGAYLLERVPEGEVSLEFEAQSYEPRTTTAMIAAGEMASHDVSLGRDLSANVGVLSGAVRDLESGAALAATVTARGRVTQTATVDPVTGLYELEVESGTYNVSVTAPGHLAQVESISIEPKEASVRNFELGALPKKMALKGVFFDSGTATIKRESFVALEEAARLLTQNPQLAVTIEGHTDSMGSLATNLALSQRRADSVMKFLVVNYGVEPQRLMAQGVGPNEPIASNETREGRALNRRIEFRLDEAEETQ